MKHGKTTMRSVEDWKREQLKNIKIRAAYNALAEEFALAEKKIKARKKKKPAPLRATPPKPVIRRAKKNPHHGSNFDDYLKEEGLLAQVTTEAIKRVRRWTTSKTFGNDGK